MPLRVLLAVVSGLVLGANAAAGANPVPETGFLVYKDLRSRGVTEVRDAATGRVVAYEAAFGGRARRSSACGDRHRKFVGARWSELEPYVVNAGSLVGIAASPAEGHFLDPAGVLADLLAAHAAWQTPLVTDCLGFTRQSQYRTSYGGPTTASASLVDLESDGLNVVEFRSLQGTFCDGALACTIIDFERRRITEVDLVFEKDLTRLGYLDFWTTEETTLVGATGGQFALIDTATHEFGHFAGLDHVDRSPELTMFPLIHDAMQTLGLGDMKGIARLYRSGRVDGEDADD